MSEENRTPTRQSVNVGEAHPSSECVSEREGSLQSFLLERRTSSSEVDKNIDAMVALLATQSEMLIQSVREFSERRLNRSTERNAAADRSRSSVRRSDNRFLYCNIVCPKVYNVRH